MIQIARNRFSHSHFEFSGFFVLSRYGRMKKKRQRPSQNRKVMNRERITGILHVSPVKYLKAKNSERISRSHHEFKIFNLQQIEVINSNDYYQMLFSIHELVIKFMTF